MCGVCGCGEGETRIEDQAAGSTAEQQAVSHAHTHAGAEQTGFHQHDAGAGITALRDDPSRRSHLVSVEQDILSKNDAIAAHNRGHFASHGVLALNLVSSPGAGKTSLLVETLKQLGDSVPMAVIEGDQETSADADRIRATGVAALQVNTGRGCHLDADMIDRAFHQLHFHDGVLFIENVGNLVCPAGFDLGEAHKVVIASVTEGEDKPLKYPHMFAAASLMLVSKIDLLPHLDFDVEALVENARRVNHSLAVLQVSANTGEGLPRWLSWIAAARQLAAATA